MQALLKQNYIGHTRSDNRRKGTFVPFFVVPAYEQRNIIHASFSHAMPVTPPVTMQQQEIPQQETERDRLLRVIEEKHKTYTPDRALYDIQEDYYRQQNWTPEKYNEYKNAEIEYYKRISNASSETLYK